MAIGKEKDRSRRLLWACAIASLVVSLISVGLAAWSLSRKPERGATGARGAAGPPGQTGVAGNAGTRGPGRPCGSNRSGGDHPVQSPGHGSAGADCARSSGRHSVVCCRGVSCQDDSLEWGRHGLDHRRIHLRHQAAVVGSGTRLSLAIAGRRNRQPRIGKIHDAARLRRVRNQLKPLAAGRYRSDLPLK